MSHEVRVPALLLPSMPGILQMMNAQVGRLEAAVDGGDFAAAARIGHNFKGAGGSCGFHEVTSSGARIEAHAKAGAAEALVKEIQWLKAHLALAVILAE